MAAHLPPEDSPRVAGISRRRFLELAVAGGAVAAAAGGLLTVLTRSGGEAVTWEDVPVRNPAFRVLPGDKPGHHVVYCTTAPGRQVAYDLNTAAHRIWERCAAWGEAGVPAGPCVALLAEGLSHLVGRDALRACIQQMADRGIVTLARTQPCAYFLYEAKH